MESRLESLHDPEDRTAVLTALMHQYAKDIRHYCVVRLGVGVGDEVAQEVWVAVWNALAQFREEASLRTWLFGIARNKCKQTFRNRWRRAEIAHAFVAEIRAQAHADAPETPEQTMLDDATTRQVRAQLQRLADIMEPLPTKDKIVLTLRYSRGLSLRDIAVEMGCSEAAVRKRLRRLLPQLQQRITDAPS